MTRDRALMILAILTLLFGVWMFAAYASIDEQQNVFAVILQDLRVIGALLFFVMGLRWLIEAWGKWNG